MSTLQYAHNAKKIKHKAKQNTLAKAIEVKGVSDPEFNCVSLHVLCCDVGSFTAGGSLFIFGAIRLSCPKLGCDHAQPHLVILTDTSARLPLSLELKEQVKALGKTLIEELEKAAQQKELMDKEICAITAEKELIAQELAASQAEIEVLATGHSPLGDCRLQPHVFFMPRCFCVPSLAEPQATNC